MLHMFSFKTCAMKVYVCCTIVGLREKKNCRGSKTCKINVVGISFMLKICTQARKRTSPILPSIPCESCDRVSGNYLPSHRALGNAHTEHKLRQPVHIKHSWATLGPRQHFCGPQLIYVVFFFSNRQFTGSVKNVGFML